MLRVCFVSIPTWRYCRCTIIKESHRICGISGRSKDLSNNIVFYYVYTMLLFSYVIMFTCLIHGTECHASPPVLIIKLHVSKK